MNHRRRKKGNVVLDSMFIVALIFCFAVIAVVGNFFHVSVNDSMQQSDSLDQEVKEYMQDKTDHYSSDWDGIFVFMLILLWIFVFAASFFIDSHPLFFGISLALLIFVFLVAGYLSNAFYDIAHSEGLEPYSGDFPKMVFIMDHFVEFIIAVALTTSIGLFGKVVL